MIKLPAYILMGLIGYLIIVGVIGSVLIIREMKNYYKLEKDFKEEK